MNRTPGIAPAWANEETLLTIDDELPAWCRDFGGDGERFAVHLQTSDQLEHDGFHAEPDRIEVDAPSTPALTPTEAVRLADALLDAAEAAGVEPHTTR